ncbi:MAG TPA: DNA primase [Jatrophihabitans sp.]|jgi:DNA primase|uniref:DNA primase n=1 Tax=Jatrophihabitans sp. TaxID=1932789 RepID=UPI002EDC12E5
MAGRIRDEDIAAVRERSDIAEVIGEHVQLRNAGGGNLKGICPFHDEKSPSLSVSPSRGLFHCFGCSAGGDVIRFVERIEHLSFSEAVESLASRAGIQLRYADGGPGTHRQSGQRARLIEAHTVAAAFYQEQLASPEAQPARDFLTGRGFDAAASNQFGCGYAPSGWDSLTKHLLGRGFAPAELTLAGLSRESGRGSLIDRFHRRLLWPIKDVGGEVVGFGARRIHDDDKIEAKYLNTPETPIYKKSQLLYGMDVAKREIARQRQAVIVEGYTDVMACHLAGVTTAVATCGTAFGGEHVNVIRRLWSSNSAEEAQATTKVIFTFDGDAAGMKAAERAFKDEQKFLAQTFVAIDPAGNDPCDLRQSGGDPAVRALIESNVPMLRFMLGTIIKRFDVDTVEGRVAALNLTVPLVAQIKDPSHRFEYARELAKLSGVPNPDEILNRVRGMARAGESQQRPQPPAPVQAGSVPGVPPRVGQAEREVIKAALQLPEVVAEQFDQLGPQAFLTAVHQQLQAAIAAAGGAAAGKTGPAWVERVSEHLPPDSEARAAVNALAVEPLRSGADAQSRYAEAMVVNLAEQVVAREVAQLKSRVQRLDAVGDAEEQGRLFGQLMQLEQRRRALRSKAIGDAS